MGLLALPAQGMTSITQAVFNAKQDTKAPFYLSVAAVIVYGVLAYVLRSRLGLMGLIIGLVVVNWLLFVAHIILLRMKHKLDFSAVFLNRDALGMVIVSLVAFMPIALVSRWLDADSVIQVLLGVVVVAYVCFPASWLTKRTETTSRNVMVRRRG